MLKKQRVLHLFSVITAIFISHPVLAAPPQAPVGLQWNMIFNDEFDGSKLDGSKWEHVPEGPRREGFWRDDAVWINSGKLHIYTFEEDGAYYDGGIRSSGRFEHTYGYYEARMKFPTEGGHWPSFWLFTEQVHNVDGSGMDGTEIDILEKPRAGDTIEHGYHFDGYGNHEQKEYHQFQSPGISSGFHSIGVWWSEDEYIFYVDGKETWRTDAGGTSRVPEYIKLTDEIDNWVDGEITEANLPDELVVDYVRVYELASAGSNVVTPPTPAPATGGFAEGVESEKDFNGDGISDLLLRDSSSGKNWVYIMDGESVASRKLVNTVGGNAWQIVATGDANGDSKTDILWRNVKTGENRIYLMDSHKIIADRRVNHVKDQRWEVMGMGDFNNDSMADILWRNRDTGDNHVYLMNGAQIASSKRLNKVSDSAWKVVGIDDFNNDGNDDLFWRHEGTGVNWMYLMSGGKIGSSKRVNRVPGKRWKVAGVADFNNDGNSDVLWRNLVSGQNRIYFMRGNKIIADNPVATIRNRDVHFINSGDYNGDWLGDILWQNKSTMRSGIYLMEGTSIVSKQALRGVGSGNKKIIRH